MRIEAVGVRLPAAHGDRLLLFVRLAADAAGPTVARPPAHLALALDASSSMGGPPLAAAVDATRRLAERLGPQDRLGVVVFDREASVVFRPQAMTDEAKAKLLGRLGAVRPGLGTNLAAGYRAASELLSAAYVPGARPRVLLLTDGYPSVGLTEPARFEASAKELQGRGIATSTIGFGTGYDEELLRAMARAGDGAYHFVADPADLAAVLAEELRASQEVEASAASVKIQPSASVTALELLHRYPTRAEADGLVVEVGTVGRLGPRRLLFEARAGQAPGELARLRASWSPVAGDALGGAVLPVKLEEQLPPELLIEIRREDLLLALARAETAVWERLARGDRAGAGNHLDEAEARLAELEGLGLVPAEERDGHKARLADAREVVAGRLDEEAARRRSRSAIDATSVSRVSGVFRLDDE